MLKLAFLLIGPQAFRARWYVLAILGGLLTGFALLLLFHASPHVASLAQDAAGIIFLVNGLFSGLFSLLETADRSERLAILLKSTGLALVGGVILGASDQTDTVLAMLFSLAVFLDGMFRVGSASIIRYPGWRLVALYGLFEIVLAGMLVVGWPLPYNKSIPFGIALLIGIWGLLLVRLSLMFRTLESEVAVLALPIFAGRGWYDNAPVLIDTEEEVNVENPLVVHVWTPVGSAYAPERRLLLDRYIAAVDGNGVISTGHSALEMQPDVYISHYPALEIERSQSDLINSLRGSVENNFKGRFLPSYEHESNWWCQANAHVEFRNFNPRQLRAFWIGYRQDDTYNLVNRNCSVVVAAALDAALEGSLATRFAWFRLFSLLLNPDVWVAAMICSRATAMTWTPGLVLDYARTMARIVEMRHVGWTARFRGFLRRIRSEDPLQNDEVRAA